MVSITFCNKEADDISLQVEDLTISRPILTDAHLAPNQTVVAHAQVDHHFLSSVAWWATNLRTGHRTYGRYTGVLYIVDIVGNF